MSRFSLTLALVLGLSLAACDRGAPDKAQESSARVDPAATAGVIDETEKGTPMPDFRLEDIKGDVLKRSALAGKPVLLNLWATWCAPCVKEMPQLDTLAGEFGDRLEVLTVSQDLEGASKVTPFFAQNGFKHLHPWIDPQNALGFALGGGLLPTTVLYDARGREVWRVSGAYDWGSEQARSEIASAIAP